MKGNRRKSRELAMQGLYQWRQSGNSIESIEVQLQESDDYKKIDKKLFQSIFRGASREIENLKPLLAGCLDRPLDELSPIEWAILLIGSFELVFCPDTPYKVVINEAVELAKLYGGTDGHKYVNGVLDKLSTTVSQSGK